VAAIHGKSAVIYLGSATGQAAVNLDQQTDWSIDFNMALVDVTKLGSTWKNFVKGLMEWTGTLSGNFDTANTALFAGATDTGVENFYLYPQGTSTTYYYGTCWIQLGKIVEGGVAKKAANNVKLIGDGALSTH